MASEDASQGRQFGPRRAFALVSLLLLTLTVITWEGGGTARATAKPIALAVSGQAPVWKNVSSGVHPSARFDASMTYDGADGYVLLFGGANDVNDTSFLGDTWEFAKGTWSATSPTTSPSAREGAAMAYDVADGYVVLFGGYYSTLYASPATYLLHALNDTWEYVHGNWTAVATTRAPPPCIGGGYPWYDAPRAVYDPSLRKVVLFESQCGQTWAFANGTWSNVSPPSQPGFAWTALAPDQSAGYVVVYGGKSAWTTENGTWTKQTNPKASVGFTARFASTMSGCPPLGGPIVFGGIYYGYLINSIGGGTLNDTFLFKNGNWSRVVTLISPPSRGLASLVYSPVDHAVVLFGGVLSIGPGGNGHPFAAASDTWELA